MLKNKQIIFWIVSVTWLLFLATIAFLWNLGAINLVDETEPLFAEASRQMTVTGDWITPYFNGQTRFDKPPLIYWAQAIAYLLIGVNEWAVRLPSALSAIANMIFLFYTLSNYSQSPETAKVSKIFNIDLLPFVGASMMAFNIQTIVWARIGVSDMLLTSCICSALLAFFLGYSQENKPENPSTNFWYLAFYILTALAILTKGPVGIVLPGLTILLFLVYVGQLRTVFAEMRPWNGLMIILAMTLPWYALVTWANGQEYLNSFFGYHNFERFTNVVNRHSAPWYFYFVVVLVGFAPWSLYLPVAIARLQWWQRNYWQRQPRTQHLGLFALCWIVSIFGFFSIAATKLPSYVLPLMPASAILVALLFAGKYPIRKIDRLSATETQFNDPDAFKSRSMSISGWVNAIFLLVLAVACLLLPTFLEKDPAMPNFRSALQESGVNSQGAAILGAVAASLALILILPNLISAFSQKKQWLQRDRTKRLSQATYQNYTVWAINSIGFVAFFILAVMPTVLILDAQRQQPIREMANILMQVKQPDEEIVMIAFEKPSLVFYSHQPVTFFRRSTDTYDYLKGKAEAAIDPTSVLILGLPNKLKGAGLRSRHYQTFYQVEPYHLVRVNLQIFRTININQSS